MGYCTDSDCSITYVPNVEVPASDLKTMRTRLATRSNEIHAAYAVGDFKCARNFQRTFSLAFLAYRSWLRADCLECTHFKDPDDAKKHYFNLFKYYIPSVSTVTALAASTTTTVTGDSYLFQDDQQFLFQDDTNFNFQ